MIITPAAMFGQPLPCKAKNQWAKLADDDRNNDLFVAHKGASARRGTKTDDDCSRTDIAQKMKQRLVQMLCGAPKCFRCGARTPSRRR